MTKKLTIHVDGACSGNPGPAGIGVVVRDDEKILTEVSRDIGQATNNIAEYRALICALEEAHKLNAEEVKIFTDSELVYSQVTGKYKIKNDVLKDLYKEVAKLTQGFKSLYIEHVRREFNKDADRLAVQAIKKQDGVIASLFNHSGEESPSSEG